jgi:DNA end-binding protein Ku
MRRWSRRPGTAHFDRLARQTCPSRRPRLGAPPVEDRYENAVVELLKSKETGQPVHIPEAPRPSNVVNLMDALRKSIAAERRPAPERASKAKAPSKTSAERAKTKEPTKKARKARKAG